MARAIFGRYTSSSNATPSGIKQGTLGGLGRAAGGKPGMKFMGGDEMYLWLLVIIEVAVIGYLRRHFRRFHGG